MGDPSGRRRAPLTVLDRLRRVAVSPVFAVAVSVLVSCAYLVRKSRQFYFTGDDWSFLLARDFSWDSLMRPHNEHWSLLPVSAFRAMVSIFGIDHYPYFALMPILLHAGICALLFALLRRHEVTPWIAAVVVVPFAFLAGNIAENPLWDFQIGFLGSCFFGLLSLLFATGEGRARLVLGWVAMVASYMCTGMAIPMLVWLGLYVLLRRGFVRALVITVPPTLVYLVWYLAYGRQATTTDRVPSADNYIAFVTTGLGSLWQQVVRLPATGGIVLLGLLVVAWVATLPPRFRAFALSGVLAAITMFLFLAYSRAGFGGQGALARRYAYFGLAMTLPAAVAVCTFVARRLAGRRVERALAAAVIVLALIANGVVQTHDWAKARVTSIGPLRSTVLATKQLADSRAVVFRQKPRPVDNPDITVRAIARASAAGLLPDMQPSRRALLSTSASLQVQSGFSDPGLPAATGLQTLGLKGKLNASGCSTVSASSAARLVLPATNAGSEIVLRGYGAVLTARIVDGDIEGAKVGLPASPTRDTYIATRATVGDLRIELQPGRFAVCR